MKPYKTKIKPSYNGREIPLDSEHVMNIPPHADFIAVQQMSPNSEIYVYYQKLQKDRDEVEEGLKIEHFSSDLHDIIIKELEKLKLE